MRVTHIRVTYHLTIPSGTRANADRALAVFAARCPVAQTLKGCVEIEHHAVIEEAPA